MQRSCSLLHVQCRVPMAEDDDVIIHLHTPLHRNCRRRKQIKNTLSFDKSCKLTTIYCFSTPNYKIVPENEKYHLKYLRSTHICYVYSRESHFALNRSMNDRPPPVKCAREDAFLWMPHQFALHIKIRVTHSAKLMNLH